MTTSPVTNEPLDDHPHWSEPAHDLPKRFNVAWIATTWLIAFVIAAIASGLAIWLIAATADPFENGRSGVATIVAGLTTFIAFILVIRSRVLRLADDRLLNSLSVAGLHVVVAGIALLVGVFVAGDQIALIPDSFREDLAIVFTAVERSSVAAILAALLIPGVVPARGDTPDGTQDAATPQDRQL